MTRPLDMMGEARINNAHSYCAISRACARPGTRCDVEIRQSTTSNSRRNQEQTTTLGFEARNVHSADLHNGDMPAATLAGRSSMGGTI